MLCVTMVTMCVWCAGEYYNYDSSGSDHHNSVMADQLAGQWFLKASDIADDSVRMALVWVWVELALVTAV